MLRYLPAISSNQREPLRRLSINNFFSLPSVGGQGDYCPGRIEKSSFVSKPGQGVRGALCAGQFKRGAATVFWLLRHRAIGPLRETEASKN
jgi:hypothetical protein